MSKSTKELHPKLQLIFQFETIEDLKNSVRHFLFNDELLKHSSNLSDIKEAYRISDESTQEVIDFVENNTTDLHEALFDFIVIHSIELGIAGESELHVFEFDHKSNTYNQISYNFEA